MAQHHLNSMDAFNLLRRTARSSGRKIGAIADELLRTGHLPTNS